MHVLSLLFCHSVKQPSTRRSHEEHKDGDDDDRRKRLILQLWSHLLDRAYFILFFAFLFFASSLSDNRDDKSVAYMNMCSIISII